MRRFFIFLIQVYKVFIGPALHTLVPIRSGCRFPLTCSEYIKEIIRQKGVFYGLRAGAGRLSRCHAFSAEPYAEQ